MLSSEIDIESFSKKQSTICLSCALETARLTKRFSAPSACSDSKDPLSKANSSHSTLPSGVMQYTVSFPVIHLKQNASDESPLKRLKASVLIHLFAL